MSSQTKWVIGSAGAVVVTVASAAWVIATSIANVRTDLSAEIADVRTEMRERMESVEGKLDLMISGLDIQVRVATVPEPPDQRQNLAQVQPIQRRDAVVLGGPDRATVSMRLTDMAIGSPTAEKPPSTGWPWRPSVTARSFELLAIGPTMPRLPSLIPLRPLTPPA